MDGFRPINPWGRKAAMPAGWKSPFKGADGLELPLFAVHVEWRGRGPSVRVFPGLPLVIAEELKAAVTKQIKAGHETLWSNPHIVPA